MPLHGKIVVIKRRGGDGTEFPLTASCLFGRKTECDIRIQLPQVSKEHCRIDLNENKEIILTNLSSANPTRVNGEALSQSERLKHGDVITIVDRSFRFEYAPTQTPKKRSSSGAKSETVKVAADAGEKRISEVSTDPHLKDGANYNNIQRSLEKTLELESQKDEKNSPFNDLCQMIKKSLDVKTPRKSSASVVQTPSSKFCTPRPGPVVKKSENGVVFIPKKEEDPKGKTPEIAKKQGKTFQVPSAEGPGPTVDEAGKSEGTSQQRRISTPQKFTASEVIEQTTASASKSPVRRRSKECTLAKSGVSMEQEGQAGKSPKLENPPKRSSKNSGSAEKAKMSKKRKSEELGKDLPIPNLKRKRVSFGDHLSPELFDKRLPPDSPLRKGASPRRSLSLYKPKLSLLRRVSVIGLLKEQRTPSPKFKKSASPKTPTGKASPKSRSTSPAEKSPRSKSASPKATPGKKSPKATSPAQTSPKSRSASPKATSPAQKTPKSRSASPKATSPAQTSPKSRSASPKATSPAQKTPKSRSASPKATSPAQTSPKSRSASPKATSPAQKTPKSRSASPKATSPAQKTPKSRSASPKATSPAQTSPKSRSASPKATSPAQKTPKSRSASPKATSPAQKTPKSRSASPKATSPAQTSPKSRSASPKATSPAQKTPKSRSASPKALTSTTPVKTPLNSGIQTPSVQGRFSVSRIRTPSPTTAVAQQMPVLAGTPKIPLRRKSMKNASRRTSGVARSAVKVFQRRSGISRASMKAQSSWANIVKFGQIKTSAVAPTVKKIIQKPLKKVVPKQQTPARKLKDHMSTGHADSPATILVGRAHKRTIVHPTGAAPKVVMNPALFKKDMKMNEDLTGLSEMFKTPVNEKRRRSLVSESSAKKTPIATSSMVEPSVLNTPEEPDEMMVSPLSLASTVKSQRYNSEAVQRLLSGGEEASFVGDAPASEVCSESKHTDPKAGSVKTPKQKPELPICLTGIKRIMKTPRQKAEPIDDLRGKLLKTPKQKPVQQECLTGIKRIMKTPRQKAEPLEDIRGNLLVTPKQKTEQPECLTGVKRIFATPKQKVEPLEDLWGKLLKTPNVRQSSDVSLDGVKELLQTPIHQSQMLGLATVERMMKTPKEKTSPVVDVVGMKRLPRTPKQKGEPVEDNFGIKRLMKSPRLRGNPPVEDFEGLQELMEEPVTYLTEQRPEKPSDAMETQPQSVIESNTTSTSASLDKKSVRGRRAKAVKPEQEETKELPEPSQNAVVSSPARGRRGKKSETKAPPAVRHTRGRNAEVPESREVEESLPESPKVAMKRRRPIKRAQEEAIELEQNPAVEEVVTPQPEIDSMPAIDVHGGPLLVEKTVLKPKRGRKLKQPEELAQQEQNLPKNADKDKSVNSSDAERVKLPEEENANTEVAETSLTQKKSVRGKRAKPVEAKEAQKAEETSNKPVPPPVRGRRGNKMEATASLAVKRNTRTRNAKSQNTVDQPAVEAQAITEISNEAVIPQISEKSNEKTTDPVSSVQVTTKPLRGKKAKVTSTEPEKDECPAANAETPQAIPSVGKPRRGRKAKPDVEEPTEVAEDTCLPVETKPPTRAKRGRRALLKEDKQIEDDKVTSREPSEHQEPPKKSRRTRKPEQEPLKTKEDTVVPEKEPSSEQSSGAAKPRRGGRKAKADAVKPSVLMADATEKPKRGRKGEQIPQETVPAKNPEHEEISVPSPQVHKPNRATPVKSKVSQTAPAKRGRRGAALLLVEPKQEPASDPVVPAKRGRQVAAKPKADDGASGEANPTESSKDDAQDPKMTKKAVKFKKYLESHEIPKAMSVKAVRGRKTKVPDQADTRGKDGTKEASSTEEKTLSHDVVEPAKRGRRGAKVAEVVAEDIGAQKKNRRGRSAKK
ncbi:proliferation marker protein Ki-67 isoform X3 [Xiphophorus hellerii]|uniref:proliferation marker protein Ki-67 isoform X3 n=1 Tax=Xiphophorus hellerii TaxID=8084 RepID=UPI0013B378AB|nr:proliferation marker protein Ki-67 isoform X3 [Xiphophorus hellerii]